MRSWIEGFARVGFTAKAVVYLILGFLALNAALGSGGQLTDPEGVLRYVRRGDLGRLMIGLLAVGLAMYAAWRLLEAFGDANRCGTSAKGLMKRAVYALSGTIHGALAYDAARLAGALGAASGSPEFTSTIGRVPAVWLSTIAGIWLIGAAIDATHDAVTGDLSDRLDLDAVSRRHGRWIAVLSRIGVLARGAVFAAWGALLLGALGNQRDATRTDTSDSLLVIAGLPEGRWLLALTAAGLMAYGVYQLLHARYRRITPP
jgi:hypothetical protein